MTIYYIPGITIKQESVFYTLYSCFELKLQKKKHNNLLNKITELHSINVTLLLRRPYQTVFVLCNSNIHWHGLEEEKYIYSSSKKKIPS